MPPLFLLIGPPAVGKSSTSKALAAKFDRSIHIPVDDIRTMVVSGLVLPGLDWIPELVEQITLARESAIHIALRYQQAGYAVVIDDFFDPYRMREYQALLEDPHSHKFILFPKQETAHARNHQRTADPQGRSYIDQGIQTVYQQLNVGIESLREEGWIVVDTTDLSIEETVQQILRHSQGHA